jgi:hypothetical protein
MSFSRKILLFFLGGLSACVSDGSSESEFTFGLAATHLQATGSVRMDNGAERLCGSVLVRKDRALTAGHCTDDRRWFRGHFEIADEEKAEGATEIDVMRDGAKRMLLAAAKKTANPEVLTRMLFGWEKGTDIDAGRFAFRRSTVHKLDPNFFLPPKAKTCFEEFVAGGSEVELCAAYMMPFDYAVLVLEMPPPDAIVVDVEPLPLASPEFAADQLVEGATVYMPGYGKHKFDKRRIATFTVSLEACRKRVDCEPTRQFVAQGVGKDDEVCRGDSGSPFILLNGNEARTVGLMSRIGTEADQHSDEEYNCSPVAVIERTDLIKL